MVVSWWFNGINHSCLVVWNMFFFVFPYIGNHPNWLIFFRGVETTNQIHNCLGSFVTNKATQQKKYHWCWMPAPYASNVLTDLMQWCLSPLQRWGYPIWIKGQTHHSDIIWVCIYDITYMYCNYMICISDMYTYDMYIDMYMGYIYR